MARLNALSISPELRRKVPGPVRDLVLRAGALHRFDAGLVDVPSERAKRRHLLRLFRNGGHDTFVEAGTYLGDTVAFFLPHATRIVSVEIDDRLSQAAAERFRDEPKVDIIKGDAEHEIPLVARELDVPMLMFLDGHYSGAGTGHGGLYEPAVAILEKLGEAGLRPRSTLVVDDLRLFGREPAYPSLESLIGATLGAWPDAKLYAGLDSLVIQL